MYAAWNPLFADMVQTGATTRQPYLRVAELAGSGVPEPFQLIASLPVANPFRLEREIHKHFHAVRKYGRKKELFTLSRTEVVDYFHSISGFSEVHAAKNKKRTSESSTSDKTDFKKSNYMRALSFDEIMPGKSVPLTNDGYLFAVDLAMVAGDQKRSAATQNVRIVKETNLPSSNFVTASVPGGGNAKVELVTLQHAIELLKFLPGPHSKENCINNMIDIIKRYVAGDQSLIIEIEAKMKSRSSLKKRLSQAGANDNESDAPESDASDGEDVPVQSSNKRAKLVTAEDLCILKNYNEALKSHNEALSTHFDIKSKDRRDELEYERAKLDIQKQHYAIELDYSQQSLEIIGHSRGGARL